MRWVTTGRVAACGLGMTLGLLGASIGCDSFDETLVDKGPDTSNLMKPPPRPDVPDGPDIDPLTVTIRDAVLQQGSDAWMTIGLDLDDRNSQGDDPNVECRPPRPTAAPETDGLMGIDNVFGHRFYPTVMLARPTLEEDARAEQLAGRGALILQMSGWNGMDDDPRVEVWISQTVDGTSAPADDVEFEGFELVMKSDGSPAPEPLWDGNDSWWARSDTFVMGDSPEPRVRDDNAYVANRQVVVRLPDRVDIFFFVTGGGVRVRLTGGFAIATIDEGDRTLSNILVAGRWAIVDLLDTGDNVGICTGSAEFRILENQLDTIADVRSMAGTGGPEAECDAISVGVPFEQGIVGHFMGIHASPPLPNPCTDGGVPDAGVEDGGVPDAGEPDAGPVDAGVPDAGPMDAGPMDAGAGG